MVKTWISQDIRISILVGIDFNAQFVSFRF